MANYVLLWNVMMKSKNNLEQVELTEAQKNAQRNRAKGLGIALFLFALLVYAATMAHLSA